MTNVIEAGKVYKAYNVTTKHYEYYFIVNADPKKDIMTYYEISKPNFVRWSNYYMCLEFLEDV